MTVTQETLRLMDGLRRQLAAVTDQQVRDLTAAWVSAWQEVSGDLHDAMVDLLSASDNGTVTRAAVLRSKRLLGALVVIHEQLDLLGEQAGLRITADLQTVIDDAGRAQEHIIDSQLPNFEQGRLDGWDRVDARQIAAIVQRSTEQITSLTKPLSGEASRAVRAELIRGVAAGANPRETAGRIVARTEGKFNGGLTRALTIARTETISAHREAARLAQMQESDVLSGWRWLTALDPRTCPACLAKNGDVYPLAEPGPLGHQNCRCSRAPVSKSWAELGFEGIDEPADTFPDAQSWFDSLSDAEQRQILGPKRFEAWLAGDYPMAVWARRRSTPGWRDAFYVSPVPPSGGRLGRLAS